MANSRGGGTEAAGARSTDPVAAAALDAMASAPGIGRLGLAQRVRDRTGLPVATAITRIRALERQGALVPDEAQREESALTPDDGAGPKDAVGSAKAETQEPSRAPNHELSEDDPGVAPATEAALTAYRELREQAVSAYCECVAAPEGVPAAIEACFTGFADSVRGLDGARGSDPDDLLLRATRWAAAEHAVHPGTSTDANGGSRRLLATVREAARPAACDVATHIVLAIRAGGLLSEREGHLVRRHIDSCTRCRGVESSQWRAEGAFHQRVLEAPLDPAIREELGGG